MTKTFAQLKKDVKDANFSVEMVYNACYKEIPEKCKGIRKVLGGDTVKMNIATSCGGVSHLWYKPASLTEYTDDTLTLFYPGYRKPTVEEQRVLDAWKKITETEEYKENRYTDMISDGSYTYYQEKYFFKDRGMEYLIGFEEQKGCKLDMNRRNEGKEDFIRDNKIKGDLFIVYKIHR